jgi:hypothetical protein
MQAIHLTGMKKPVFKGVFPVHKQVFTSILMRHLYKRDSEQQDVTELLRPILISRT